MIPTPSKVLEACGTFCYDAADVERGSALLARLRNKLPASVARHDKVFRIVDTIDERKKSAAGILVAAAKAWGLDPNAITNNLAHPTEETWAAAMAEILKIRARAEIEERIGKADLLTPSVTATPPAISIEPAILPDTKNEGQGTDAAVVEDVPAIVSPPVAEVLSIPLSLAVIANKLGNMTPEKAKAYLEGIDAIIPGHNRQNWLVKLNKLAPNWRAQFELS